MLEDAGQAEAAADKLEKRIDRLSLLRDQMVEQLKGKQKVIASAKAEVRSFVKGTDPFVVEVLATLV